MPKTRTTISIDPELLTAAKLTFSNVSCKIEKLLKDELLTEGYDFDNYGIIMKNLEKKLELLDAKREDYQEKLRRHRKEQENKAKKLEKQYGTADPDKIREIKESQQDREHDQAVEAARTELNDLYEKNKKRIDEIGDFQLKTRWEAKYQENMNLEEFKEIWSEVKDETDKMQ